MTSANRAHPAWVTKATATTRTRTEPMLGMVTTSVEEKSKPVKLVKNVRVPLPLPGCLLT